MNRKELERLSKTDLTEIVIHLAYLQKRRPPEIARLMGISEHQYYRELKAALQAVAVYILGENHAELAEIRQIPHCKQ